jgi:hypothetical protein
VAGFLLPDHIDEAVEVFDVAGGPLGHLVHESFGGGVVWEPAAGRPLPADARPLEGLAPPQRIVGHLAAGLVAEDARQGLPARPEGESALSALLRAIDTTLWSVDAYAGLGTEHVVGLVGRPIPVVRARLSLEVRKDLDDLDLSDPQHEDELRVHLVQTLTLTLLMHPAGRVHLTSGVLPRKSLRLQRDWVAPGLAVMAPSARVGPVLMDPAKFALPLISVFPKEQLFTRRDSPLTWKDDPILAATQTALLPDLPHEIQEGYIRIAPAPKGGQP